MSTPSNPDRAYSRFRITGVALVVIAACGIGTLWGVQRLRLSKEGRALKSAQAEGPRVRVAVAGQDGAGGTLTFQGEALPNVSTTLYAKVSGFLRRISVDKGSPVRQGQVLAVLESTETDRDTSALKADFENKRRSADRTQALAKQGIVSAQAVEDAEAAANVAKEKLASQAAVQGYQRIVAPFSGVVTQRFADPGAMVQNGGTTSTAQPILSLAQVDRLRVALYLDQQVASRVKVGTELEVSPADRPDAVKKIVISRLAGALDSKTRTLLAEADLDNHDGLVLAGGSVQVTLKLPSRPGSLQVPSEAVVLREGRTFVAVAGSDHRFALRPVVLGDDTGQRVQVLQGLQAGERVILSPPVTLKNGDKVQAVETAAVPAGK